MSLPIDQRAVSAECVGQELNLQCPEAGGLQPPGRANAQPTHSIRSDGTGGSRTHITKVRPGFGRQPAEGEGVEPSRLIARPSSSRVPSPFGLPFRSCSTGGRNRTCELLFNREAHEPAHATPVRVSIQSGRPDSNRRLPVPNRADSPGFPTPRILNKCPAGVEPALPPWQGGRLPLHHGHDRRRRIVKESESTGWDSNPRRRITGAESSPLDDRCKSGGTEGLKPSPPVRAGLPPHISIPSIESAREESNLRLAVISRLFCR